MTFRPTFAAVFARSASAWVLAISPVGAFTPPTVAPDKLAAKYDVVIAGAGTGGCGAAIQAARMGASVLLLDETDYIGGQMNAAAVTSMDEGGVLVRERGIYKELVERIESHYGALGINAETAYWFGHICVEPRVGRKILHEMLAEAPGNKGKLDLSLRSRVTKVAKSGDTVTGVEIEIVTPSGKSTRTLDSSVLIDATEWGDVIPLTGARYRSGNTLSDAINPTQRIQDITWAAVVKQYPEGVPDELKMKSLPPDYQKWSAAFAKTLVDGKGLGGGQTRPWNWEKFIGYRGMPDSTRKPQGGVITRTHMNFNNDFNASVADIENPASRRVTERGAIIKTLCLLYYVQNVLGKTDWSVADDEGYDTPYNRAHVDQLVAEAPELEAFRPFLKHFPPIAYARESRRIIGQYTLKAADIERKKGKPVMFPNCVAIGDYAVDLHGSMTPKYMELDLDREQDIPRHDLGEWSVGPFAIPFESFIPEKIDGFLPAEKNISQSRLGNGATRLQPHTMLMGQAAGAISVLAVKNGIQPRAVEPVLVQTTLLDAGDVLLITPLKDLAAEAPEWKAVQLVATRGMILPEEGYFGGNKPLSRGVFAGVLGTLAGGELPGGDAGAAVSRKEFAEGMAAIAARTSVKFTFGGAAADQAKEITRSEAATVVADLLRLGAIARQGKQEQALEWNTLRPASPAAVIASPVLKKSVKLLQAAGIVTEESYWLANAREGGLCDGELVATVMRKSASKLAPGDNRHPAEILVDRRVLSSAEYWKSHALAGKTCVGENVERLIRGVAKQVP